MTTKGEANMPNGNEQFDPQYIVVIRKQSGPQLTLTNLTYDQAQFLYDVIGTGQPVIGIQVLRLEKEAQNIDCDKGPNV